MSLVGEEQPRRCGLACGQGHGVGFAHPAIGQFLNVDHADAFLLCAAFGGDAVHDLACFVGRAVVDGEDFEEDALLRQQGAQCLFDGLLLVSGWDDDGDSWLRGWSCGAVLVQQVWKFGEVAQGDGGAPRPENGDQPVEEDACGQHSSQYL